MNLIYKQTLVKYLIFINKILDILLSRARNKWKLSEKIIIIIISKDRNRLTNTYVNYLDHL
jgi:hypothetical protein